MLDDYCISKCFYRRICDGNRCIAEDITREEEREYAENKAYDREEQRLKDRFIYGF